MENTFEKNLKDGEPEAKPRHLPEYLEGRTPQKNTLFIRGKRNPARAK